jgi:integrase/recombinase XerD
MKAHATPLGPLLQRVVVESLGTQKRASPHTSASDRATLRLVLEFLRATHRLEPAAAGGADLDGPVLLACLDHRAHVRHNAPRSRTLRLAAIRSFWRLVARRDPASVHHAARVLALPVQRADRQGVKARSRAAMDAILATPELGDWRGRRDHARLWTWSNSGARVAELTAVEQAPCRLGAQRFLPRHGKGRTERTVPLWTTTALTRHAWCRELSGGQTRLACPRARGRKLTRKGVAYLLPQGVARAAAPCPSLRDQHVTPQTLRHTPATHLLQSGVDLVVIALWLGHDSPETPPRDLEADLATNERALPPLAPAGREIPRFRAKDEGLAVLATRG